MRPDPSRNGRVKASLQKADPRVTNESARVETIVCRRCGEEASRLEKAPFRTELGERVQAAICQSCWKDWLKHQTSLINHYGLDPRDPKARDFLYAQIDQVLLGGGDAEQVDTSQKGSIEW